MCKDISYNHNMRLKLDGRMDALEKRLSVALEPKDFNRLMNITKQHRDTLFEKIRDKQRREYSSLRTVSC